MKKLLVFPIVCFILLAFVPRQVSPEQKAKSILEKVSAQYTAYTSYKASFTNVMDNVGDKETTTGEIMVKASKFYLKMGNMEIVNNGVKQWNYLKEENEVTITDYNASEDDFNPTKLPHLWKNGQYKYLHKETKVESGVSYEVVDLEPIQLGKNSVFKVRLTIKSSDNTIKAWKIFEKTGITYTFNINTFTPNVAVGDNVFNFNPALYKGIEIVDLTGQ